MHLLAFERLQRPQQLAAWVYSQLIEGGSGLARFGSGSPFSLFTLCVAGAAYGLVWSDELGSACAAAAAINCSITAASCELGRP